MAVEGGVESEAPLKEKLWEGSCGVRGSVGIAVCRDGMGDMFIASFSDLAVVQKGMDVSGVEKRRYSTQGPALSPFSVAVRADGAAIAVAYLRHHVVVVWEVNSGQEIGRSGHQGVRGKDYDRFYGPCVVAALRLSGFAVNDCLNHRIVVLDDLGRWQRVLIEEIGDNYFFGLVSVEDHGIDAIAAGTNHGWVEVVVEADGRRLRRIGPIHVVPYSMAVDGAGQLIVAGGKVRRDVEGEWNPHRYGIAVIEEDGNELVIATGVISRSFMNVCIAVLADGRIAVSIHGLEDIYVV